ncbi:TMV resistance protein N-like [Prunus yedoensis var. nudiflora]|uniref:TMV resistance protein N-like n=1 Tax=Prunus yedoensis var. nudiflora TaxID=2094558 RepID=A0A314UNH8_PRUYE|nr:TMV resistance protein N-like [Prunus yedoensis var. nudiflora]
MFNKTGSNMLKTSSNIKECGARLVYERDLEEFSGILKIPKRNQFWRQKFCRNRFFSFVESKIFSLSPEAGPIGSGLWQWSNDESDAGSDRSDEADKTGSDSCDDNHEPGSGSDIERILHQVALMTTMNQEVIDSSDDDDEPISKRFKKV